jgi:hypothetical protein
MRVVVRSEAPLCDGILAVEKRQLAAMALETAKDKVERGFKRCVAHNDILNSPTYSHDCKGTDCSLTFAETACKDNCGSEITFHTHPPPSEGFSDQDFRQAKLNNKVGGCVAYEDPFRIGVITMKCVRGEDVDFQKLSELYNREKEILASPDLSLRGEKLRQEFQKLHDEKEEAFKVCTRLIRA